LLLVDMQSQVFNALGSAFTMQSSLEFSLLSIILSAQLVILGPRSLHVDPSRASAGLVTGQPLGWEILFLFYFIIIIFLHPTP